MVNKTIGNLIRVNHAELRKLILAYYRAKRSLMTWGTIGIGKSREIEATACYLAEQKGKIFLKDKLQDNGKTDKTKEEKKGKFCIIDIRLSQIDATDIKGIPFRNKDATATTWLLPDWLPTAGDGTEGILFFDEINLAPPSIQASAYSLILDRKIGNYILPEGWICLAAGNRVEDKSNVFEMATALENRFGHCELTPPTSDEWKDWALEHNIDKRVIAFILWKPDSLMTFKPEEQMRIELKEKAFATPRTWEYASDLITGIEDFDTVELLTATAVGLGLSTQFRAFLDLRVKINFKEIINNPDKLNEMIPEERDDLLYAFITVVADWYKSNAEKKHLQRICQIAEIMRGEFSILMLRMCKREHPQIFKEMIKQIPEWTKTLSPKYADYIL